MRQLGQGHAHFFLVRLGFGFNRDSYNRLGEFHPLQNNRLIDITQGFTSNDIFQADARCNITRIDFFDFFTGIGMHLDDTTDALAFVFDGVEHSSACFQDARIATHEGQRAHERVSSNLNARAENGALSSASRLSASSVFGLTP